MNSPWFVAAAAWLLLWSFAPRDGAPAAEAGKPSRTAGPAAPGATYYVNNVAGGDSNDGKTQRTALATIARAVSLCKTSDRMVLADTGVAYAEPMLMGRLGGVPERPFVIDGGGAVLSGLAAIEPERWERIGEDRYILRTVKKPYGNPYLANRGKRLASAAAAETLAPEEFYWDPESGIYFRCAPGQSLASYKLAATLIGSGFSTSGASYVICRNLICEHFANDGFNMHGDCRGIYLENVTARYNGDDGISIHESGGLVVRHAHVHHNTYGIQDVNASQSFYNGVLAEHNQVGASFCGGFHTLVDCVVRNSAVDEIDIAVSTPKHLIGAEFNPLCATTLFAGNVVIQGGGRAGLRVHSGGRAIVEHCVIAGLQAGVVVHEGGACHLTASVVADCQHAVVSDGAEVFRDYNVYHPGRMKWFGVDYRPDQWDLFRQRALHDQHSRTGPVTVAENGEIRFPPNSPAREIENKIGPTALPSFNDLRKPKPDQLDSDISF